MEIKSTELLASSTLVTAGMDVRFEPRFKSEYPTGEKACLKLKAVLDNIIAAKDYASLAELSKILNVTFESEEILVFPHRHGPKLQASIEKLYDNVFVHLHRQGKMPTAPALELYVKNYKPTAQKKSLEILDESVSDGRQHNAWEGIPKAFIGKMNKMMGLAGGVAITLTDSALKSIRDYPAGVMSYVAEQERAWQAKNPEVNKPRDIPPHRFDIPRPERMVSGDAEDIEEASRTDMGLVHKALNAFKSAVLKVSRGGDLAAEVEHAAKSMHLEVGQFKGMVVKGIHELENFDGTYTEYVAHRLDVLTNQVAGAEAPPEEPDYEEGNRVILKSKNGEKPRTGRILNVYPPREGKPEVSFTVLLDSQFRLGNDDDGEVCVKLDDIQGLETPLEDDSDTHAAPGPVNAPTQVSDEEQDKVDEDEPKEEEASLEQVESAILGTEYYTMFKLKSAKLVLRRRNRDYEFRRGDPLGWRFSSNGKFFRLISPFHGAKIVFSIPITEENLTWLMRQDPKAKSKKNPKNPK